MDWPGRITILEDLMRRLSRALADMDARLRRAEQNLQQVGGRAGGGGGGLARAKVTTAIPGGTFASPSSSGEAQIYHKNAAGSWVASGDPVQVFNQFGGGEIAVDAGVLIAWISGDWFVVAADCPPEPEE